MVVPPLAPGLDGRRLIGVTNSGDGKVGTATVFDHHQREDVVRAECAGGGITLGRTHSQVVECVRPGHRRTA